jgi:hypothetical protein
VTQTHHPHDPVKELVRAVQALCLFAAEDGTLPDEESLTRTLMPFAQAFTTLTPKGTPHGLGQRERHL